MSRVLVLGATGKVGGEAVRLLAARSSVSVVAGVRDVERAAGRLPAAVEVRHLDLDDEATLAPALHKVDSALLLTGYTIDMLAQSKRFLDAAARADIGHIVHIGASGADTNEVAHWGWHQYVERYIEALGFGWTHLRPEAFMQNLTAFGWLRPGILTSYIGDARWSWVDCDDVAAVAANILATPSAHRNNIYRLGVSAASMHELARMLSAELDWSIEVEHLNPDLFYERAVGAGADAPYANCVRRQFHLNVAGAIRDADATFTDVNDVLGREPIDWQRHIRRHAQELRAFLL